MHLGWVDFSDAERDKAMDILHLLQEPGAVDELGIGVVRDAFADAFFPGTSTLLTRAKYYLLVPYILREKIAEGARFGWTARQTMAEIDDFECKVGERLYKAHQNEKDSGIIGRVAIAKKGWVKRAPSVLYWNGIRTFGICPERDLSLPQYVKLALSVAKARGSGLGTAERGEEAEGDDMDAGGVLRFKPLDLHGVYRKNWFADVDIPLSESEAVYLQRKILENVPNSLLSVVLRGKIDLRLYGDFAAFAEEMSGRVDPSLRELLELSCRFMRLVYAARVRYNVLLQNGRSDDAVSRWQKIPISEMSIDPEDVARIFLELHLDKGGQNGLFQFLQKLACAFCKQDVATADDLIRNREKVIKGEARAKLLHPEKYSPENWIGGYYLDYRLADTARIVTDIYDGLGVTHV